MRIFISLSIIITIFIFGTHRSHANCEAGSYNIHTIALYKKLDPKETFFLYQVPASGNVLANINPQDGENPILKLAGEVGLQFGKESCNTKIVASADPITDESDPDLQSFGYSLSTQTCGSFQSAIPSHGYFSLDTVSRKARFPKEMKINDASLSAVDRDAIEKFITKDLKTRSLFLLHEFSAEPSQGQGVGKISPEMIDHIRFEQTTFGSGNNQSVLTVAILRIKGLKSAYQGSDTSDYTQELRKSLELKSGKADFPVIYYKPAGHTEPLFIGDGSTCSYVRFEKYPAPVQGAEGAFDRFVPSKAFDMDHDGALDILEINKRFAYRFKRDGKPEVISFGSGC